jgi:hypothetical protein
MIRGLFMMPTRGLRMMRGFLVMAHLMVFGGFLVMTTTTGGDTLHAQACALGFTHVPWRGIKADLACDAVL